MAKFNVFEYNQWYMAKVGLYSYHLTRPTNDLFHSLVTYYMLFFSIAFSIISSATFAITHTSQFTLALETCFILIAGIQGSGVFLSIGLKMKKVKVLHLNLQEIVDQAEGKVAEIYWETEQMCRKYTKNMTYYNYIHLTLFLPSLIIAIYNISIGNYDVSMWDLPFNIAVPFDGHIFWGWWLKWFIQINMAFAYAVCLVTATSYFLCSCLYMNAICDHFNVLMESVNEEVDRYREALHSLELRKFSQNIKDKLVEAIVIHVKLLEIFKLVADINNGTIFSILPINAIFMAIAMYKAEHVLTQLDILSLNFFILSVVCGISFPLVFCSLATHVTARISSIGDTTYNTNWFDFPTVQRKFVKLIINRSQKPVMKSSMSYYLIFRRLNTR